MIHLEGTLVQLLKTVNNGLNYGRCCIQRGCGVENLIRELQMDEELQVMRKEWKELGIEKPFPLFHFETCLDIEDYKKRVKEKLSDYKNRTHEDLDAGFLLSV